MTYEKLETLHELAVKYLDRIGESQPHFRDGSVGKLYNCEISTKISHQRSSGDQNYHTHAEFDAALSYVVRERFAELAQAALDYMKLQADKALITEELALRERLRLIEKTKEKLEGSTPA